ncbi:MAG: hypothetical protein ACOZCO_07310 [Bacteroidota bacterium]
MKYEKQTVKVPIEIFLEVCQMIYTGNLYNKILGSSETMGEVILEIGVIKANPFQRDALKNVMSAVNEWNRYRYGHENPEDVFLR